jgi:hypothetical protein
MNEKQPKYVVDCLMALRSERLPLAARLDAIDLAIDNLSRVFGAHGSPQPLSTARTTVAPPRRSLREAVTDSDAAARRVQLLDVIGKSDVGVTLAELRRSTPQMDGKDRSNTLQQLKAQKKIKRAGNTWKLAA